MTGAEALYAAMGLFGHRPLALAWECLVLPGGAKQVGRGQAPVTPWRISR
ncbi:KUP/HAK/KT family potassium transporter [uncultured Brachybacterium sp.]